MADLLQVRDLTTHFFTRDGEVGAVDGVSYSVAAGETIALVGESGCGKTVSALSIVRLIPEPPGRILSGKVLFDGADLLQLPADEMRLVRGGKIAMIFQEPMTSLNPVLTVGRQITEALELHQHMNRQDAFRETVRLLKLVGIPNADQRARSYPHHLSGGMRQRVMIAMAISCKPKLIIADEPTTALDVTIQAQLLELMRSIARDLGTATILITHNLGVVARYARRVYVMYAGKIVEHGPALAVYHDPRHPYTVGLLASVPRLDEPRKTRLAPIEGQPPDLVSLPRGCAFQARCSFYSGGCEGQALDLLEVSPGHYSVCWQGRKGREEWAKT
ncbi:MAG: ABC transporter ATP-binding protein [Chloroflexi bacterium]|nr:ABC transporter ATP-binding protein [Chloroflexota bacterium]